MAKRYFVDVSETYTARIEVTADSLEEAEELADELVGGGKVDIVKLTLSGGEHIDYARTCEAHDD